MRQPEPSIESSLAACQRELAEARKERDAAHAHACEASLEERDLRVRAEAAEAERDKLLFNLGRMAATDTREDRFAIVREIASA